MTSEAQRIAIAEACGWKREITESQILQIRKQRWLHPNGALYGHGQLPDYLSDLNAMHEAEKVLTDEQCEQYWVQLSSLVNVWNGKRRQWVFEANAAQRAEAFLRTLNLWEESE